MEWKYNNLTITQEELESVAEFYAENYLYDTANGTRPERPLQAFEDDFGSTDDAEAYLDLYAEFFALCEKYKNDPELIAKYTKNEDDEEDEFDEDDELAEYGRTKLWRWAY